MGNNFLNDEEIKTFDDIIYILYQHFCEYLPGGDRKKKIENYNKQRDLMLKIRKELVGE